MDFAGIQVVYYQRLQRLKTSESSHLTLGWNLNREIAKLITAYIPMQSGQFDSAGTYSCSNCLHYADEADILNVALFGQTTKQWKNANPRKKGNMRDEATLQQLLVLANMESYNAILIEQGNHSQNDSCCEI